MTLYFSYYLPRLYQDGMKIAIDEFLEDSEWDI